eukprot:s4362_g4.t1
MYNTITGQPWETALAFTTWRRQFLAVCETVSGPFARYVEAQFDAAHKRHELGMAGGTRQDIPAVDEKFRDWESRLVVGLLKVLPQDVKSAVVEDNSTTMTSLGLLEEVVTLVQPGGREEVASLLSYVTGLQPATSAKKALEIIRLKLHSLRTRLSIMKLAPEVQFPIEKGLGMMLDTLENELRQASADETLRLNKRQSASEDVPTAAKGKGKGKEAGKTKGKESKGKQGKTESGGAPSEERARAVIVVRRCHVTFIGRPRVAIVSRILIPMPRNTNKSLTPQQQRKLQHWLVEVVPRTAVLPKPPQNRSQRRSVSRKLHQ